MNTLTHEIVDGIAYTCINNVHGLLNELDCFVLISNGAFLPENSVYVETGSYLGCSGILQGLIAKKGTLVYCHDLWLDDMKDLPEGSGPPEYTTDLFNKMNNNIINNKLENTVIPIRGDSKTTLDMHKDETVDLAFIDGDHSYEGVKADLSIINKKIKPNGTIICHDILSSPVYVAIHEFVENNDVEVKYYANICTIKKRSQVDSNH